MKMSSTKLKLEIANMTSSKIPAREFFAEIARRTLELAGFSGAIEMELAFVGEGEMRKLNRVWRGKNKATDVLSFGGGVHPHTYFKNRKLRNIASEISVGVNQIIICLPYSKKEARKQNLTFNQELAMLFCHGILHILGHDHERSKKEEVAMWEAQDEILKKLKS